MSEPQTLSYESTRAMWSGIGIGTIALQLVGVYCMVLALPMLSMLASWVGISGGRFSGAQLVVAFVPVAIYAVMGVLLIRYAPRISAWLFRDATLGGVMSGPVTTSSGQYLQASAFSVVGVVLVVHAAPSLVPLIWVSVMDMGRFTDYGGMIEPVARILLGVALFLHSKGLAVLWHKIRGGGVMGPRATDEREARRPGDTVGGDAVHSESERA